MSQQIFRIERAKYAAEAPKGVGAFLYGARWNSPGRHTVYCGEHLSLAILEVLVHLTPATRKCRMVYFPVTIEATAVHSLPRQRFPKPFNEETDPAITQKIGDEWLKAEAFPVCKVPSVIVPGEFNFLLNPGHPEYTTAVKWGAAVPLELDGRIGVGTASRKGR